MTDKEVQLFILRHLEAGNTKADEHILTDVPEKQRRHKFIGALIAIENQGFLCPNYRTSDKPELWNAYVSTNGRAFIERNTAVEVKPKETEQQDPLHMQLDRIEEKQDAGQKTANLGVRLTIWGLVVGFISIIFAMVLSDDFLFWISSWFF